MSSHRHSCFQAKGYAEGAGDSLAGGLKKNVAKVTGNDQKEAEGTSLLTFCNCSLPVQPECEAAWFLNVQARLDRPRVMPRRQPTSRSAPTTRLLLYLPLQPVTLYNKL